ncbi:MAG: hypothetical protein WKF95_14255 [Rubrobacter sp.]
MVSAADNASVSVRPPSDRRISSTLLASVLVLVLLLCHGAMGGFHQLAPELAASPGTPADAASHAHADRAGADRGAACPVGCATGDPTGHPDQGVYLAALFVVILASVLRIALGSVLARRIARPWAARRSPAEATILRRHPPGASLLQVLRL